MSSAYPTSLERRSADRLARELSELAASFRRQDARRAIRDLADGFAKLRSAGASKDYLSDALARLLDELSNIDAAITRDMDGADPNYPGLDVSELKEMMP